MIKVDNIHKSFQSNHVLRGLNFSVPPGHITGLVGPNGSGKSTSIRILTGFSDADEGTVHVDGELMTVNSVEAKRLIGYAPESAPSYREQTVCEYLSFVALLRGVEKKALANEVDRAVSAFSLQKVYSQSIGTLSKGYRHRTSLAQCLLGDPPVIILDEPTDGLDPIQKIETRKIILELSQSKAVLMTTHLLEEVEMLCDRVVAIGQGEIAFSGTMQDVVSASTTSAVVYLRVAHCSESDLQQALGGLEGLADLDVRDQSGYIEAELSFDTQVNPQQLLDDVSLRLFERGLRAVELRREDPPLSKLFSGWAQAT